MIENLKSIKSKIPPQIRSFLFKAVIFFIVWKIIYVVSIYNGNFLDYPLTTHIGEASVKFLNSFDTLGEFTVERIHTHESVNIFVSQIYLNGKTVLNIADACNGLELIILYIGFIICMPSNLKRKIIYIIIGAIIIDATNILRCAGLIYLRQYFHMYFDFAHHYIFKAVIYIITFILWIIYSRKIKFSNETVQK